MKLKVFHKGLILTGLPLLVEFLLIASLLLLLVQSDREKQLEADYRRYSSLNAKMQALVTESPYLLVASFQQGSDKLLNQYSNNMALVLKYAGEVKKLVARHPQLAQIESAKLQTGIDRFLALANPIVEARRHGGNILDLMAELPSLQKQVAESRDMASFGLHELVRQGEQLTLETQKKQASNRNLQTVILITGLVLNIVVSIALAMFYRRNILARIRIITANTRALSQGQKLSPLIGGGDEIALLDLAFHNMHKQLIEVAEREKELFNNASDLICVLDSNDRFSKLNPACLSLWGYEASEMIGMSLWDLLKPGEKPGTEDHLHKTKSSRQAVSFENKLRSKSGKAIEVLWSAYWSDREQSLFCIVHDLSERKQVERARQQFLAMVSSDLKSPLSAISTAVSKLLSEPKNSLPEKAFSKLDIARKNVQRLLALVNDLLQLSELDMGNIEIKKQTSKIDEILHRAMQDVEAVADKHKVKLQVKACSADWFVDPDRIMQVLVNLLSNAIKFSPEDSTVLLEAEEQGDYILCKVMDRGRGVPESHKQAIFEKFKQVEASDGKRKSGTGLGLPICKQIVEDHGGSIGVSSVDGKGSTFWFRLPKDETASMKLRAQTDAARAIQLEERGKSLPAANPGSEESEPPARKKKPSGSSRLNLAGKGAFLVGVPVAFELLFVGALFLVLQHVDQERAIELHQRMIAFDATKLMGNHLQGAIVVSGAKTREDWYQVQRIRQQTNAITEELLALLKNDPVAFKHMLRVVEKQEKMQQFFRDAERVMTEHHNDPKYLLQAFADRDKQLFQIIGVAHRIQKVIDDAEALELQSPNKQKSLRQRQYQVLLGGLATNLLASLLLTVFFARDITGRLMVLADNAARLANEKSLNPELEGRDEIADLDRVFHQTAAVLDEARQKERAVFDNSQDVICAIASDASFSSINPACQTVWGYSKEEMRFLSLLELSSPEDRELTTGTLLGDFGTQPHINFESRIIKKDGSEIYALWSASRAPEQSTTFCIVHDISDKKELEKLKQEFLAMVSHDLRTPLTSITGVAKLILAGAFGPISEAPASILNNITKNGDRLLELINDLLDIEKFEAGKMQLVLENTSLKELIAKTVSQSHCASDLKVHLDENCAALSLECDRDRMIQALSNIINYALSRSPSDRPVELWARLDRNNLEIEIKDCGSAIPAKVQSHIFERFKDSAASNSSFSNPADSGTDDPLTQGQSGKTGLALPIAKRVIESHGGEITLSSNESGARFLVSLIIRSKVSS